LKTLGHGEKVHSDMCKVVTNTTSTRLKSIIVITFQNSKTQRTSCRIDTNGDANLKLADLEMTDQI